MNLSAKLFVLAILPTAILTLSIAPIEGENELAIANQTKGKFSHLIFLRNL